MSELPRKRLPVAPASPSRPPSKVALLSLTTMCNARCAFCCVLNVLNKPELDPSDETVRATMREARATGCTILSFTGGEPTVHPRFAEFCRYGKELGFESITINTNGIQFKNRAWTEQALASGLSNVDFSIHGHNAEVHDAMVARPGAFAAIERGMSHLRELAPLYGTVLGATCVVTATNAKHLTEVARVLLDLGFRTLRFKHCFEGAPGSDASLVGYYSAMIPAVREIAELCKRRGASLQLTHFPLCLLGEQVVFATDLGDENVLSLGREGEVLMDGRVSEHRREKTWACERCLLVGLCAGLDKHYRDTYGDSELAPFLAPEAFRAVVSRGADHYGVGEVRRGELSAKLAALGASALAPQATRARPQELSTALLFLAQGCEQRCSSLCDCHHTPTERDDAGLPALLSAGGRELTFRGESARAPEFPRALERAREGGWEQRWVRTSGALFAEPEAARELRARGATGVLVPLFSQVSAVHDRITGVPGSLVVALRAMRQCAAAGLDVAVEVPLLSPRLQSAAAVVELAARAAPGLRFVRFYSPSGPQPEVLAPPPYSVLRPQLERALEACRERSVVATVHLRDGIPRCALPADQADALQPAPSGALPRPTARGASACSGCAAQSFCPGPPRSYTAAHGERDLAPFPAAPAADSNEGAPAQRVNEV